MKNIKKLSGNLNTKDTILKVACKKYLELGDAGFSMRSIAKEIGITPMAIYKHFENKEALQHELLKEAFRIFSNYLYEGLKGKSAKERFDLTADAYFNFAVQQSAYFELIFLSVNPMNSLKARDVIRQESMPSFQFLVDRVRDCINDGYLKDAMPMKYP
ncbi:TetR/AcrR family transcriptional regulator [Veronia nyctiphanis]|uniref:TetR/AcrR family transcriptional regulator n=1 Tax=Veronia nyctiphanis TaxID=1278244 RepID=UPI0013761969|nr:TetR/AcrR family transcriptional regulator [Veronia nyctiphanis]